jgi:hypothetical protein
MSFFTTKRMVDLVVIYREYRPIRFRIAAARVLLGVNPYGSYSLALFLN